VALEFSRQPFSGSDVAAFVFAVLALVFIVLHWRDRERGMSWLAVAYLLLAIQYSIDASTRPVDTRVHPVAALTLGFGGAVFNVGMLLYLASPAPPRRWQMLVAVLPSLAAPIALLLQVELHRPWAHLPYAVSLFVLVIAAIDAARREPEAGHQWIAAGLLTIPAVMVATMLAGVDTFYVRYYALPPALFFGVMLIAVSLLRRRKALEAENARRIKAERALTVLNASLERTVVQRTADLQSIVSGLESFNRNVSHDLRGSLGGMAGLARVAREALEQRGDPEVARRVLPLIEKQASQSADMVSALLTLAKVGDQHLKKALVDLDALTRDVIASLPPASAGAAPRFVIESLPTVHADADLLRPVLANLLGNAVKFCGDRPDARIEVSAHTELADTVVQVRDNGVGFSATNAANLFLPFSRLHGREFAGHGVGLSIVQRAIERHGGRVWAESETGKGASFFFSLPHATSMFGHLRTGGGLAAD